jgi:hypothetical protein
MIAIQLQLIAFLILITAGSTMAIQALSGEIRSTPVYVIGILSGVATAFLLFQPRVREAILSGIGPFQSEALTFDTKFEDMDTKLNGRIRGSINSAGEDAK